MILSYNWLIELLGTEISIEELAGLLTGAGLEVEEIKEYSDYQFIPQQVVSARVLSVDKHPQADKLTICEVDAGPTGHFRVVCGAPNVRVGQMAVFAPVDTILTTKSGKKIELKKAVIRGVESEGMLCAEDEIGISDDHSGIMTLDDQLEPGISLRKILGEYHDYSIEVSITPNRGDAISHLGALRDLAALKSIKLQRPSVDNYHHDKAETLIDVEVLCPDLCYRYSGLSLSHVEVKDSPDWLQNRLKACGINPINCVVDVTNYVMLECGQPLHAFDMQMLEGNKIIVRTAKAGEPFKTLDEKEIVLNGTEVMICDAVKPVAIGGVMGGLNSMINAQTRQVFLESACFSPSSIRKTASFHGYSTDASYRFERGTDPELTVYALKRAALLLKQLANAEISGDITDIYPGKKPLNRVNISFKFVNAFLGVEIPPDIFEETLNNLEYRIVEKNAEEILVEVPSFRTDVSRPVDVIEDFLRIYGFDKIAFHHQLKGPVPKGKIEAISAFQEKLSNFLVANGFYEILTPSFISTAIVAEYSESQRNKLVKTLNAVNVNFDTLRKNFLFSGLEALSYNVKRNNLNLKFFEFGRVYFNEGENQYKEYDKLGIWITGNIYPENWNMPVKKADFYYLKSIINNILSISSTGEAEYRKAELTDNFFVFLQEIVFRNEVVGLAGQVHPALSAKFDLKGDVFYSELNPVLLNNFHENTRVKFKVLSKFPAIVRDLSVILENEVSYDKIMESIRNLNEKLIQQISLIDYYTGENIGKDKKSYTIRIRFQHENKTLTDEEADEIMKKIINSLEQNLKAQIRK